MNGILKLLYVFTSKEIVLKRLYSKENLQYIYICRLRLRPRILVGNCLIMCVLFDLAERNCGLMLHV